MTSLNEQNNLSLRLHNLKEAYLLYSFLVLAAGILFFFLFFGIIALSSPLDTGASGVLGFGFAFLAILLIAGISGLLPFFLLASLFIKKRLNFLPKIKPLLYVSGIIVSLMLILGFGTIMSSYSFIKRQFIEDPMQKSREIDQEYEQQRLLQQLILCPQDKYPEHCIAAKALVLEDTSLCNQLTTPQTKQQCIQDTLIFVNQDFSACDLDSNVFDAQWCAEELAYKRLDEKFCYRAKSLSSAKACAFKVRFFEKYPEICLNNKHVFDVCQTKYVKSVGDAQVCQQIMMSEAKQECQSLFTK